MRVESVDFYYLSMPEITIEADGSQDALLVRVTGGEHTGWGECEASPLTSIAAYACPMSHGMCQPVSASVLNQPLNDVQDIASIAAAIRRNSMDLLQAVHTWSGIEMALWDLLGKSRGVPVWNLLGYARAHGKTPYASILFGDSPQETLSGVRQAFRDGFSAVKVGWGPIGLGSVQADADQFMAAREGLGRDGVLLVDAGQVWREDVHAAEQRLNPLEEANALWLEEPFYADALGAYGALSRLTKRVRIAGGEGCHNAQMGRNLIDYGGVGFIQIDCGRIGGIGAAKKVADYALARSVDYVNHTFTSHLALSASLQPYAGMADHYLCEFPTAPKALARELTANHLHRTDAGKIELPDAPGLGIEVNPSALEQYRVDVEILVDGTRLIKT